MSLLREDSDATSAAPGPRAPGSGAPEPFGRVRAFWSGPWTGRRGGFTAAGAVLCIAAIAASTGAIHARLYGHDIFFLLDNGWRALRGQRVHVDYSSAWGPLTFLLVAAGLAVSGGSVAAVSFANAFAAAAAGLWSVWLAGGRTRTLMFVICPCFVALLVAAPFALGEAPVWTSHGMVYNRYGYALLTILMLECFQPAAEDRENPGRRRLEAALTGCALGLLLFLKISYFLVALPLLGMSLLFRPPRWSRALAHAAGFLVTSLAFLAYLQFDAGAMFKDLVAAGAARSGSLGLGPGFWDLLPGSLMRAIPVIAVSLWCRRAYASSAGPRSLWRGWFYPSGAALVVVADTLLLLTNAQPPSYPLTAAYTMILLLSIEPVLRTSDAADFTRPARFLYLTAGVVAAPMFLMQMVGLGYGFVESRFNPDPRGVLRFEPARLHPLVLYDVSAGDIDRFSNGREYVSSVNEGIRLLAANTLPQDKVTTLDMFNPFAYALAREPIRGGIAAAAYRYTLDAGHYPSPARFFGDAAVVMVPKFPASPHLFYDGYRALYQPALEQQFRLETESPRWLLYRRAASSSATSARTGGN